MIDQPNPGSNEALAKGCRCPILDNAHGVGVPGMSGPDGEPQFWINERCPLPGSGEDMEGEGE
jgi:hypothetical protein